MNNSVIEIGKMSRPSRKMEEEKKKQFDGNNTVKEESFEKEAKIDKTAKSFNNEVEEYSDVMKNNVEKEKKEDVSTEMYKASEKVKNTVDTNSSDKSSNLTADSILETVLNVKEVKMTMNNVDSRIEEALKNSQFSAIHKKVVNRYDSLYVPSEFTLVSDLEPYITYIKGKVREDNDEIDDQIINDREFNDKVIAPSDAMFRPGTIFVQYGINDKFFKESGELISPSVYVSKKGLQSIGVKAINSASELFNALLAILTRITDDRRIWRESPSGEESNRIRMENVPALYEDMMSTVITVPVRPSLPIAAKKGRITWLLKQMENFHLTNDIRYRLGYMSSNLAPAYNAKVVSNMGVNVDQYSVEINNRNYRYLNSFSDRHQVYQEAIKAYCPEIEEVFVQSIPTLTLLHTYKKEQALSSLMIGVLLSPSCKEMIVNTNELYFEHANVFRSLDIPVLHSADVATTRTSFDDTFRKRFNQVDFTIINRMYAMEISPKLGPFKLSGYSSSYTLEECIVEIYEYFLLNLFFPNLFNTVKGQISNRLIDTITQMFKVDGSAFKKVYGYKYYYTNDTTAVPVEAKWNNMDDYYGVMHPSFFGSFKQDDSNNVLVKIAQAFRPAGEYLSDDRAIAASFPRLSKDPKHYISYVYSNEFISGSLGARLDTFDEIIRQVVDKYIKAKSFSNVRMNIQAIQNWLIFIRERVNNLSYTLQAHMAPLMRCRANSILNFINDFDGSYKDNKPINYGLFVDGSNYNSGDETRKEMFTQFASQDQKYIESYGTIYSAAVWRLTCGVSSAIMDATRNSEGITHNESAEKIVFPSPKDFLTEDLQVLEYFKRLGLGVGIVSNLLSNEVFADNEDKEWILNLLANKLPPNATVNALIAATMDRLKVVSSDLGRVHITLDVLSTPRTRLINPVFRRVLSNSTVMIPFDSSIDPENFSDVQTFFTEIEVERFLLGMKFLRRSPLMKVNKGIRLYKHEILRPDPDYKPVVPADYIHVVYTSDLFKQAMIESFRADWVLNVENETYTNKSTWPKLHVVVEDRLKILDHAKKLLLHGVMNCGWIVDFKNLYYVPKFVGNYVNYREEDLLKIIMDDNNRVNEIEFCDSVLNVAMSSNFLPAVKTSIQFIYPLDKITKTYCVSGIGNINLDNMPVGGRPPLIYEFDTGNLIDDVIPSYTIADMTLPKTDYEYVSMTNIAKLISKNVSMDSNIAYTISRTSPIITMTRSDFDM